MPGLLSRRLFPLLQLTRMALVFTAISNTQCALLLELARNAEPGQSLLRLFPWAAAVALAAASTALYGFGMSLNDIIDRRRDSTLAAHRPLPSGRISIPAAHVICFLLGVCSVVAGALYARWSGQRWESMVMLIGTGLLITFYDLAGKYLVALGLVTLGLIRFFHALIAAPDLPVLWHPLWLLNHVTIVSLVAYLWEQKRPALTRIHWWTVIGMLGAIDALLIGLEVGEFGWQGGRRMLTNLQITRGLIGPAVAGMVFIAFTWVLRRRREQRIAGQILMLYGLLWLIVYDVLFVAGYVSLSAAGMLLMLLPVAYGAVQFMRWWGRIVALSSRPGFRRAEA